MMIRAVVVSLSVCMCAASVSCSQSSKSSDAQDSGELANGSARRAGLPSGTRQAVQGDGGSVPAPSERFRNPSLVKLIVAPDKFRGAEIRVTGFWVPDGSEPDGALFLDRESAAFAIRENAVHVRFGKCRRVQSTPRSITSEEGHSVAPGYVVLGGVFEPSLLEDVWPYTGEICSVWKLNRLPEERRLEREKRFLEMAKPVSSSPRVRNENPE